MLYYSKSNEPPLQMNFSLLIQHLWTDRRTFCWREFIHQIIALQQIYSWELPPHLKYKYSIIRTDEYMSHKVLMYQDTPSQQGSQDVFSAVPNKPKLSTMCPFNSFKPNWIIKTYINKTKYIAVYLFSKTCLQMLEDGSLLKRCD